MYNAEDEIDKSISINLDNLEQDNINHSLSLGNSGVSGDYGNGNAGGWVKENMYIVAFIYDNTTFEIQQVEQAHLITQ